MALSSKNQLLSLLLLILSSCILIPEPTVVSFNPSIGITYSRHPTSNLPRPDRVVSTLRSLGVTHVRILNPDHDIIRAFSYSGISLLLSISNTYIHAMAANQSQAVQWLYRNVVPFYPRAHITTISVGNDILTSSPDLTASLISAIRHVHLALHDLGIRKILVSTTLPFDIITSPFPPSAAEFKKPAAEWIMKPILDFITTTNSSFLINAYPYKLFRSHPEVPIGYALFQQNPFNFREDPTTGVQYRNLFDVMVDAVNSAMAAMDHKGIPVIVTETGWPSDGDVNEPEANKQYASMYNVGLVRHLRSGLGTPMRREGPTETYIFELFDEDMKQGPRSDRHWGVLNRNMTMKYPIPFSGSNRCFVALLKQMVVSFCLMFAFLV
ncbi:glucan endo-1,3-beta-glucosidase 2-like [Magnolia sinica]|uniref:glucan endo-1,3-beta-glucosidase 2-like n=1 Tax=Magnolia sinica TaxID=86752 RepID=UPI002659F29B|nr:glucan endo-1,3-beta-glucosidase 2-like [Magnolia sinica]